MPIIPVDASARVDVELLVELHKDGQTGSCVSRWGLRSTAEDHTLALLLHFLQPLRSVILLDFDLRQHGVVIDQIVQVGAFGLTIAVPGQHVAPDPQRPPLLVDVPCETLAPVWDEMWQAAVQEQFRREGLSATLARSAAREFRERSRGWLREIAPGQAP